MSERNGYLLLLFISILFPSPATSQECFDIKQGLHDRSGVKADEPKVGIFVNQEPSISAPRVLLPRDPDHEILSGRSHEWECNTKLVTTTHRTLFEQPSQAAIRLSISNHDSSNQKIFDEERRPLFTIPLITMPSVANDMVVRAGIQRAIIAE